MSGVRTDGFAESSPSGGHDVSILIGIGAGAGRYRGSQPRVKTSMMIMRAPQRGQVQGCTRGSSGVAAAAYRGFRRFRPIRAKAEIDSMAFDANSAPISAAPGCIPT